ncbi:MAG TPA: serine hydrolase domain-containing protein [Verrucomicrobiae bacterium]|nr:serine hydrolase domain-containing protein [Verrucomicrobiae bacterium]
MIGVVLAAALTAAQVQTIESTVHRRMADGQIPSVVVRIDRDGTNVYARAFGYRNVPDRLPATVQTRYQYGSITKQFTAAAILSLADDARLSLDDRVGKWLPDFAKFNVTIRQLLIHTSGIADFTGQEWYFKKDYSNPFVDSEPLLQWSASQPLAFTPGTKAQYDNAAYVMLARIVEKASGKSFFGYLSERFLQPLGMTSVAPQSFFRVRPDTALGYMFAAPEIASPLDLPEGTLLSALPWNMSQVDGAGFLVGDAADLQKWDNALLAHRVLKGEAEKLFYSAGTLDDGKLAYTGPENPAHRPGIYCYGGLADFLLDATTVYGANGGTSGFLAFTGTVPSKHLSVTILTNHGADLDNSKLTLPILSALIGK